MTIRLVLREAVRLHRAQPIRTAITGGFLAIGTALTILTVAGAFEVVLLGLAVLVVARQSPHAERLIAERAWQRAGASMGVIRLIGVVESLSLGLAATACGSIIGMGIAVVSGGHHFLFTWAYLGGQSVLIVIVSWLAPDTGSAPQLVEYPKIRAGLRASAVVLRIVIVVLVGLLSVSVVRGVNTDTDLAFAIVGAHVSIVIMTVLLTRPIVRGVQRALFKLPGFRGYSTPALQRDFNPLVRALAVFVFVAAATASVLGASVQARPLDRWNAFFAPAGMTTVMPTNVVLVRVDFDVAGVLSPKPTPRSVSTTANTSLDQLVQFAPRQTSALRGQLSSADVARLRGAAAAQEALVLDVVTTNKGCVPFVKCGTVAVYQAELVAMYRNAGWTHPQRSTDLELKVPIVRPVVRDRRAYWREDGRPRTASATFNDAVFDFVDRAIVESHKLTTRHRAVLLTRSLPFTRQEIVRVEAVARHLVVGPDNLVSVISRFTSLPDRAKNPLGPARPPRRRAPFALTSDAQRLSLTAFAGTISILGLLAALGVQTLDRRSAVRRLEHIGATPGQIRGAVALQMGTTLGVVAWLAVGFVSLLVKVGTDAFNRRNPELLVPFRVPWLIFGCLLIAMPLCGAALAAFIARPIRLGVRS